MKLEKSVIFTIFHRFERKYDVTHLQYLLYLLRIDNNTLMYAFGDIAWTRGRTFTKCSSFFYEFRKSLSFLQFFIDSIKNTKLHTFYWGSIRVCNLKTFRWILLVIQPGLEVEYLLSFHKFWKFFHFHNFSSNRTKTRRCTPSIGVLSVCTIWKHSIEYFRRYSLDTRPDRETDRQTEKLKPISPRFTGDKEVSNYLQNGLIYQAERLTEYFKHHI